MATARFSRSAVWMLLLAAVTTMTVTVVRASELDVVPETDSVSAENTVAVGSLDIVSSEQLISSAQKNKYVLALLVGNGSPDDLAAEETLTKIRSDVESVSGSLQKVKDIEALNLAARVGLEKLPALLFYRNFNPVILEGVQNEDAIMEWLQENKEPSVHELDDSNFEHLTQAATGATTGDWFVLFCNKTILSCRTFMPRLEAVAGSLKMKKNVAYVDTETNREIVKRFNLPDSTILILLSHSKMYRYTSTQRDVESLTTFALTKYADAPGEDVPKEGGDIDMSASGILLLLKEYVMGFSLFTWFIIGAAGLTAYHLSQKKKEKANREKVK